MSQFVVIMVDVLFQQTNWKKYSKEILTFVELFLLIDLNQYTIDYEVIRKFGLKTLLTT